MIDLTTLLETPRFLLILLAVSWLVLFAFTILRPQRLFNCALLLAALFLTLLTFCSFLTRSAPQALAACGLAAALFVFLIPLMLIWNGIVMLKKESRSFHNILSLLIGLFMALAEIALLLVVFTDLTRRVDPSLPILLQFFIGSVLYGSALLLSFILYTLYMQLLPHLRRFDTIIVHGCALLDGDRVSRILANRLDKALELFRKSRGRAMIVVSGGQGDDETVSEAEAMRAYLLEKGVPDEQILLERFSRSTEENLRFSRQLLEEHGGGGRIALVTSNYHVYRCILLARELNMRCTGIGAKVAWYYWPSAVIREFAAVFTRRRYFILTVLGYGLCVLLPLALQIFGP